MELGLVEPGLLGGEDGRLAGLVLQVDPVAAVVDVERRVPRIAHLNRIRNTCNGQKLVNCAELTSLKISSKVA